MAAGVPVVAAGAGAIPEVVGDAALLVDPLDPGDLAAGLAWCHRRRGAADAARGRRPASGSSASPGRRWPTAWPPSTVRRPWSGPHVITVLAAASARPASSPGWCRWSTRPTITAIVNTGDDTVLHGLTICPDLDTVTYTLAGAIDPERGWGLAGETWAAMGALERFAAVRPRGLGGRRHVVRPRRPGPGHPPLPHAPAGRGCHAVDRHRGDRRGLRRSAVHLLPMTDDPRRARMVTVVGEGEIGFQEYFVGRHHDVADHRCPLRRRSRQAAPGPGRARRPRRRRAWWSSPRRTRSCRSARSWPCRACGERSWLAGRRVVAVSPIIGGARAQGPGRPDAAASSARESSVVGVARCYRDVAGTLVDRRRRRRPGRGRSRPQGVRCVVTDTIMQRHPRVAAGAGRRERAWPRRRPDEPCSRSGASRASARSAPATSWPTSIAAACAGPPNGPLRRRRRARRHPEDRVEGRGPPRGRRPRRSAVAQGPSSRRRRCGSCAGAATSSSPRPATASCAPTAASTSRTSQRGEAALLPLDSDRSARRIRDGLRARLGVDGRRHRVATRSGGRGARA